MPSTSRSTSTAGRRRPGPGAAAGGAGELWPWAIVAAAAFAALASAVLWVAGGLASMAAGPGWRSARLSPLLAVHIARNGTARFWPGTPPSLVLGVAGGLLLLLLAPPAVLAGRWAWRRPQAGDPVRSLARAADLPGMTPGPAAAAARRLRPSLTGVQGGLADGDVGVLLGGLEPAGRPRLFASWEDVLLAIMAPRSGKTTALAVPAVLAAPGPVVTTSNKTDLWAATAALRGTDTGQRVWTFDPQRITRSQQDWWWNPLADLTGDSDSNVGAVEGAVEQAERLASHFVLTVDDESDRDIWGPAASELLAALFLAAAVSDGTLADVYDWLNNENLPTPVQALRAAGYRGMAASLSGVMANPPETRGSVYFTARTAARCLRDDSIIRWVTPPPSRPNTAPLDVFDPEAFVASRQSLYLLSKDGGGSAAPLVAALTDRVLQAAVAAAEAAGGRLDPPLLAVLDEAANVCRIADLPKLYSHLGSRGIVPITLLQNPAQAVSVWGKAGFDTLLAAATVTLIGSGVDDPDFAEDISRLIGDHDTPTLSVSTGDGRTTRTRATRTERILSAAQVRALPKGTALLFATGAHPALIRTRPWYTGPRATDITTATSTAVQSVAAAGRTGPGTPTVIAAAEEPA